MAPFYEYGVYLTFSLGNRLWCSSRVAGELRLPSGWRGTPDRMHLMSFLDDEGGFPAVAASPSGQDRSGNRSHTSGRPESDIMFIEW